MRAKSGTQINVITTCLHRSFWYSIFFCNFETLGKHANTLSITEFTLNKTGLKLTISLAFASGIRPKLETTTSMSNLYQEPANRQKQLNFHLKPVKVLANALAKNKINFF